MKITYGITLDEFRTLQPPLHRRIGAMGLAVTMGLICLLLIAPGVGVVAEELSQGQRPPAAALASIAVGLLLCAGAYWLDRRSSGASTPGANRNCWRLYDRIHCRNARVLEADAESLTLSCDCGLVAEALDRTDRLYRDAVVSDPAHAHGLLPIPRSAFATEGELTEFRRLILEKLHTDRPFNACPIEFAHTRADFWRAKLLHVRKGGGWRRMVKLGIAGRRVSLHHRGGGGGRALGTSARMDRARGAGRLRVLSGAHGAAAAALLRAAVHLLQRGGIPRGGPGFAKPAPLERAGRLSGEPASVSSVSESAPLSHRAQARAGQSQPPNSNACCKPRCPPSITAAVTRWRIPRASESSIRGRREADAGSVSALDTPSR